MSTAGDSSDDGTRPLQGSCALASGGEARALRRAVRRALRRAYTGFLKSDTQFQNSYTQWGRDRVYSPPGTLERKLAHLGALDALLGTGCVHSIPEIVHWTRKHAECTQAERIRVHSISDFVHSILELVHSIRRFVHSTAACVQCTIPETQCTQPVIQCTQTRIRCTQKAGARAGQGRRTVRGRSADASGEGMRSQFKGMRSAPRLIRWSRLRLRR